MTGSPSASAPTRRTFSLTGPSVALDPIHHAVRRDLADIRLAGQVFAPHYAAPMAQRVVTSAVLRGARGSDGEELATLEAGAVFEVLEITHGCAWGVAPTLKLVGFVPTAALEGA